MFLHLTIHFHPYSISAFVNKQCTRVLFQNVCKLYMCGSFFLLLSSFGVTHAPFACQC